MRDADTSKDTKFEVLTAALLKIPFLWDVNVVPTGSAVLILKMETLQRFEMFGHKLPYTHQ
jgi:hypothetical protein